LAIEFSNARASFLPNFQRFEKISGRENNGIQESKINLLASASNIKMWRE